MQRHAAVVARVHLGTRSSALRHKLQGAQVMVGVIRAQREAAVVAAGVHRAVRHAGPRAARLAQQVHVHGVSAEHVCLPATR